MRNGARQTYRRATENHWRHDLSLLVDRAPGKRANRTSGIAPKSRHANVGFAVERGFGSHQSHAFGHLVSFSRSHLWTASRACDSISAPTHCFLVTATPCRNSTFSRCSLRAAFVGWRRQQVWKLPRGVLKGLRQETMSSSPTNIRQKEFQSIRHPNRYLFSSATITTSST